MNAFFYFGRILQATFFNLFLLTCTSVLCYIQRMAVVFNQKDPPTIERVVVVQSDPEPEPEPGSVVPKGVNVCSTCVACNTIDVRRKA